jgi:hypothetical protein
MQLADVLERTLVARGSIQLPVDLHADTIDVLSNVAYFIADVDIRDKGCWVQEDAGRRDA